MQHPNCPPLGKLKLKLSFPKTFTLESMENLESRQKYY